MICLVLSGTFDMRNKCDCVSFCPNICACEDDFIHIHPQRKTLVEEQIHFR